MYSNVFSTTCVYNCKVSVCMDFVLVGMAKIDCTSPSPIVGHRIEVATSVCSSSGGSRAVEKGEGLQEAQENRLDFRTIINRSREEKKDGERSVYEGKGW